MLPDWAPHPMVLITIGIGLIGLVVLIIVMRTGARESRRLTDEVIALLDDDNEVKRELLRERR